MREMELTLIMDQTSSTLQHLLEQLDGHHPSSDVVLAECDQTFSALIQAQQDSIEFNTSLTAQKDLLHSLFTALKLLLFKLSSFSHHNTLDQDVFLHSMKYAQWLLQVLACLLRPKDNEVSSTNTELLQLLITDITNNVDNSILGNILVTLQKFPTWITMLKPDNNAVEMLASCGQALLTVLRNATNAEEIIQYSLSHHNLLDILCQIYYTLNEVNIVNWTVHESLLLSVVFNALSSTAFDEERHILRWRSIMLSSSTNNNSSITNNTSTVVMSNNSSEQGFAHYLLTRFEAVNQSSRLAGKEAKHDDTNKTPNMKELNNTSNLMQALSPAVAATAAAAASSSSSTGMESLLGIMANVFACSASKDAHIVTFCHNHEAPLFEGIILALVSNITHLALISQLLTSVLFFLQPAASTASRHGQQLATTDEEDIAEKGQLTTATLFAKHGLNETLVFLMSHSQSHIDIILQVCQCIQLLALDTSTTVVDEDVLVQNQHIQQLIAAKSCEILTITVARQLPGIIKLRSALSVSIAAEDIVKLEITSEQIVLLDVLVAIVKSFVMFAYYEERVVVRFAGCGAMDILLQLTEEVLQVYCLLLKVANNNEANVLRRHVEDVLHNSVTLFFFLTSTSTVSASTEYQDVLHQLRESTLLVMLIHMMKHMFEQEEFMFHATSLLVHLMASSSLLPQKSKQQQQQHDFGFMMEQALPNTAKEVEKVDNEVETKATIPAVSFAYLNLNDFCEVLEMTMTRYVQQEAMMDNLLSILRHVTTKALKHKPTTTTTTTTAMMEVEEDPRLSTTAEGGYFDLNLRLGSFIVAEGLRSCFDLYHEHNGLMMIHICIIVGNLTAHIQGQSPSVSRLKALEKMKDKFMTCKLVDVIGELRQPSIVDKYSVEHQGILKNVTYYAVVNLTRDHVVIQERFANKYEIRRNLTMWGLDWMQAHPKVFHVFVVVLAMLVAVWVVYAKK